MMIVHLIEKLRAAIDEDEQWAKAASFPEEGSTPLPDGAHWVWGVGENWDHYEPDPLEQFLGENVDCYGTIALVTAERRQLDWGGEGNTLPAVVVTASIEEIRTVDAAHIVRHDPARVLQMVAAHRTILDAAEGQLRDDASDETAKHILSTLAQAYGIEGDG